MKTGGRGERAAKAVPACGPREMLEVSGAEGLHVLGRFFQAMLLNLLQDPRKVRTLEAMDVVVAVDPPAHPHEALTLDFSGGHVALASGISGRPDIVLRCEAAELMKLARIPPGPAAARFFMTHEGKALLGKMRSGELKIQGAVRHPLGMKRFAEFLAPNTQ